MGIWWNTLDPGLVLRSLHDYCNSSLENNATAALRSAVPALKYTMQCPAMKTGGWVDAMRWSVIMDVNGVMGVGGRELRGARQC